MASSKPNGDKPSAGPHVSAPIAKKGARCPICTAPTELAFRPFCSRRCSDVDLSRWLRGAYAVPGRADVDEDGDDTAAASQQMRRPSEDDGECGDESGGEDDQGRG